MMILGFMIKQKCVCRSHVLVRISLTFAKQILSHTHTHTHTHTQSHENCSLWYYIASCVARTWIYFCNKVGSEQFEKTKIKNWNLLTCIKEHDLFNEMWVINQLFPHTHTQTGVPLFMWSVLFRCFYKHFTQRDFFIFRRKLFIGLQRGRNILVNFQKLYMGS